MVRMPLTIALGLGQGLGLKALSQSRCLGWKDKYWYISAPSEGRISREVPRLTEREEKWHNVDTAELKPRVSDKRTNG